MFVFYLEPTKSLRIKSEYTQRDVVRLVDIFNCLTYDWTVKDDKNIYISYLVHTIYIYVFITNVTVDTVNHLIKEIC